MSRELFHAYLANLLSDFGENRGDHGFERLFLVATGLVFELPLLSERDEVLTFGVGSFDFAVLLGGEFRSRDNIVDAKGEAIVCCWI